MSRSPRSRPARFPGQVADAAGPHDLTATLLTHHGLRRDLGCFAAASTRTPLDDLGAWAAMVRRWRVLEAALAQHHVAEAHWLWPTLLVELPGGTPGMAHLPQERASLEDLMTRCRESLGRLADGMAPDGERAALSVRMTAARESLLRLLAVEEREVLPAVQRLVPVPAWAAATPRGHRHAQPADQPALLPWALHGLDRMTRRDVLSTAPAAHRAGWRLTHGRFERLDALAFRHVEQPGGRTATAS